LAPVAATNCVTGPRGFIMQAGRHLRWLEN